MPFDPKNFLSKCAICCNFIKWWPVLFIFLIIAWSYYAYVVQLCFFAVEKSVERAFYLVLFHFTFGIFIWSYWQTIFTKTGTVPRQFKLAPYDAEQLERELSLEDQFETLKRLATNLPVQCRTFNGSIRYCEKCHQIKPDRAHHCSVCGMCVLKMDHHCPWVNNCVCFTNYKFFVLFLGYGLLYCLFIASTTLQYFVRLWTSDIEGVARFHILFLFFVSVMFGLSLMSLFGYHLYLISVNRSTLESFRAPIFVSGPDKNGFNLGRKANFTEIFGDDKSKWFIPVPSSLGDGVSFPSKSQTTYNSMGNTGATTSNIC